MAMDPIQQSPFVYYPQVAATGGDIGKSFSSGYTAEQQHAANALAMDAARQQEVMNQQAMRLKETEEARKQALFKQGMADRARIAGVAATPWIGGPTPTAPSGGGNPAQPPLMAPAAPAAPGPQAEYNPESDLPGVNARVAESVGTGNAPGGFHIPGGPGASTPPVPAGARAFPMTAGIPTAAPTAPTGQPNPYGEVNPNAPQFVQHLQGGLRGLNTESAFRMIQRQLGGGMMPDATAVSNYFAGSPEKAAAMQTQSEARSWYDSPQVQSALRANPQLLLQAEQNPLGFYQANKDAFTAPAAAATATPAATVETPQKAGVQEPSTIKRQDRLSIADEVVTSPVGTAPEGLRKVMESADIVAERSKIDTNLKELGAQYKIAMATRDFKTANELRVKGLELTSARSQLGNLETIVAFNRGDAAPLANLLNSISQQTGGYMQLQPRPDGNYNIYDKGKLAVEGVTPKQLEMVARAKFDDTYRAQLVEAKKTKDMLDLEAAKAGIKVQADATTKAMEQQAILAREKAVENFKQSFPNFGEIHPDPNTPNRFVAIDKRSGKPAYFMAMPKVIPGKENLPATSKEKYLMNADGTPQIDFKQVQ